MSTSGGPVDRATLEDLAAASRILADQGVFDAAITSAAVGLGLVHPVVAALLEQLAPAERQMDPRIAVPAAGLQHQNAACRILGQAGCECASGRAGTDDDVIERTR